MISRVVGAGVVFAAFVAGALPAAAQDPLDPLDRRPAVKKPAPAAAPPRANDDPIPAAIKKGVEYLKADYKGVGKGRRHGIGVTCLVGLALLESGVPPTDPVVQQITSEIRHGALDTNGTYEISLILMYLDRLGSRSDEALIQFMGARLLAGQGSDGTWTYTCKGAPNQNEKAALRRLIVKDVKLRAVPEAPALVDPRRPPKRPTAAEVVPRDDLPEGGTAPELKEEPRKKPDPLAPKPANKLDAKPKLHEAVSRYLKLQNNAPDNRPLNGDHSNVQFATVGVWCARKHGLPVEKALERLEKHYREVQSPDGGWGYVGKGGSSAAMTCAGLMGLAMAHGEKQASLRTGGAKAAPAGGRDPGADAAIKDGLKCLGGYLAAAAGQPDPGDDGKKRRRFRGGRNLANNYYFMWSLERVGVIFGLQTIGDVDWYEWGSEHLVESQGADGSWGGGGFVGAGDQVNTCFALLFLNRANFTKDLSTSLAGKIKDPGKREIKGLEAADLKKFFESKGKGGPPPEEAPKDGGGADVAEKPPAPEEAPAPAEPAKITPDEYFARAEKLAKELLFASPEGRPKVVARLRDSKGAIYTEALLRAIPKLDGEGQRQAREALASRVTRMKADTLRDYLKDESKELRRAAALATAGKGDTSLVPDLIEVLQDDEPPVVMASYLALKKLTGKDFGPRSETKAAREKAAADWKAWWEKQKAN